jgi:hypothetical protein
MMGWTLTDRYLGKPKSAIKDFRITKEYHQQKASASTSPQHAGSSTKQSNAESAFQKTIDWKGQFRNLRPSDDKCERCIPLKRFRQGAAGCPPTRTLPEHKEAEAANLAALKNGWG